MSQMISRRAALLSGAGVVVGAAAMLLDMPNKAVASSTHVGEVSGTVTDRIPEGFTDLAGIQAEYAEAVRNWPFAQPEIQPLSRTSSFTATDDDIDAVWELGSGVVQAHFEWASAMAATALAAHRDGDGQSSQNHLLAMAEAYESELVSRVTDDPEGTYLRLVIGPAQKQGNYAPLAEFFELT